MTERNKKLLQTKVTQKSIAEALNTSEGYVHEILSGKKRGLRGKGLEIKNYVDKILQRETEEKH